MSVARLWEALQACSSQYFDAGDLTKSEEAVAGVVGLLDSMAESPPPDAEDALGEIHRFLSSPDSNQMVVDALSLELPKVVIRFASISDMCEEIAGNIIKHLVGACSPRDMLPVLCEVLDTHINVSKAPACYTLILNELSKVFHCIKRRQMEQVKVALPIILKVLDVLSLDTSEEDDESLNDLFGATYSVGISIQRLCEDLDGRSKEELSAILGLYALENIAFISRSTQSDMVSCCIPHIVGFSNCLKFCKLSYDDLITGRCFDLTAGKIIRGDGDDFMTCFSFARDGAFLAVIWGLISNEVANAAGQHLDATLSRIRSDSNRSWLAVSMLKSIFLSHYRWEIKSGGIELLLSIMDGSDCKESCNSSVDFASLMPGIYAVLKGIERIIICAPNASLRKSAFGSLKKVLSSLPCNERFDALKALVSNSASSMMALLIDLVKEEIRKESGQINIASVDEASKGQNNREISPFWSPHVLDMVELVLKPPIGGPPTLPDHSEPVLSALNLYRYILILESSGKTNQTGVLSEDMLRKALSEWLLPLRTLAMGIQAESEKDGGAPAEGFLCGIAPVQLVLHRCIELVEEKLKHSV